MNILRITKKENLYVLDALKQDLTIKFGGYEVPRENVVSVAKETFSPRVVIVDGIEKSLIEELEKEKMMTMSKKGAERMIAGVKAVAEEEAKVTNDVETLEEVAKHCVDTGVVTKDKDILEALKGKLSSWTAVCKERFEKYGEVYKTVYDRAVEMEERFDSVVNRWKQGGDTVMAKLKLVLGHIVGALKKGIKFIVKSVVAIIKFVAEVLVVATKNMIAINVVGFKVARIVTRPIRNKRIVMQEVKEETKAEEVKEEVKPEVKAETEENPVVELLTKDMGTKTKQVIKDQVEAIEKEQAKVAKEEVKPELTLADYGVIGKSEFAKHGCVIEAAFVDTLDADEVDSAATGLYNLVGIALKSKGESYLTVQNVIDSVVAVHVADGCTEEESKQALSEIDYVVRALTNYVNCPASSTFEALVNEIMMLSKIDDSELEPVSVDELPEELQDEVSVTSFETVGELKVAVVETVANMVDGFIAQNADAKDVFTIEKKAFNFVVDVISGLAKGTEVQVNDPAGYQTLENLTFRSVVKFMKKSTELKHLYK